MKFRNILRPLAAAAVLVGVGLAVPAVAVRPLGGADSFEVLASVDVNVTGPNSVTVSGNLGAGGVVNDSGAVLSVGGTMTTGSGLAAPLAAAQAAKDELDALTGILVGNDLGANDLGMGAGVYPPGFYEINGRATTSAPVTLMGTGGIGDVWVFNVRDFGDPSVPANAGNLVITSAVSIGGGGSPLNVYWNADRSALISAPAAGLFIAGNNTVRNVAIGATPGNVVVTGVTVTGKVISVRGNVNLDGSGAAVTVASGTPTPTGPNLVRTPSAATHVVNPGQLLSLNFSASDPDSSNTVTLSSGALPPGAFYSPALPITGTPGSTVSSNLNWTPGNGQEGNYEIPVFATDSTGLIDFEGVDVRVNSAPTFDPPTPPDLSVFAVCPGETIAFSVVASDVDPDQVTITQTGAPAGSVITNVSNPGNPAQVDFSYTAPFPGGTSDDVTFTATDPFGRTDVRTFTVVVYTQPSITATVQSTSAAGTGVADGGTVRVCVGEELHLDITASDADPGDSLALEVAGTPTGAQHSPNFLGDDGVGTFGGDLLVLSGNPITARLLWTPTVADARSAPYTLTYSAVDSTGCVETHVVNIQVSRRPALSVTLGGQPVANNSVIWACPAPQAPVTFMVTGTDADPGATVTLSRTDATSVPSLSFAPGLPAVGNPVTSTATFAPSAGEQGASYPITLTATDETGCAASINLTLRVSRAPVITVSGGQFFTLCPGQTANFTLNVSDADTVGSFLQLRADTAPMGLRHTQSLPTSGNPITVQGEFTAQDSQQGQTIVVTYTATDQFGCVGTATVTFVVDTIIPSLTIHQTPAGSGVTGAVNIDEEVCYTVTVRDQCGQPLAGRRILFSVQGGTGNNVTNVAVLSDANGEATYCLTPRFPGTNTVTGGLDANLDGQLDPGEIRVALTMTVIIPASTITGRVVGSGAITIGTKVLRRGQVAPVRLMFNINVKGSRRGVPTGPVTLNLPGTADQFPALGRNFRSRSILIDALVTGANAGGRTAIILGEASTSAFGRVRYRVDVQDGSPAGGPNDRVTVTFLTAAGPLTVGGFLDPTSRKDDIQVVTGISD